MKKLKSKLGNEFGVATVKDESGKEYPECTIFGNTPNFADLREGSIIEGDLLTNDYNGKQGWKLSTPKVGGKSGGNPAANMEKKEKSIGKAMDRKEASIEKMATFRDATMLTVAWASHVQSEDFTTAALKDKWVEMRLWLEGQLEEAPF